MDSQAIDARFDRSIRHVSELATEPRGLEPLADLGQELLADRDDRRPPDTP